MGGSARAARNGLSGILLLAGPGDDTLTPSPSFLFPPTRRANGDAASARLHGKPAIARGSGGYGYDHGYDHGNDHGNGNSNKSGSARMASTAVNASSIGAPGVTGAYDGDSLPLKIVIGLFTGLAIYNAIELAVLILLTFARYRGLYFWSLLVASLGLVPYSLGFLFKFFNILTGDARWASVVLLTVGWYLMVTGQSVVLWSRLHLIVFGRRAELVLRLTKWMIVLDVLLLHVPTTVVTFGSNGRVQTLNFVKAYNVIEKYQMTGFFIQEVILSMIYIVETIKILRTSFQPQTTKIMRQLVAINIFIIALDLVLLGFEYASLFIFETVLKGFIYSIKLKLEFAILGRLVNLVGRDTATVVSTTTAARQRSMAFVEERQASSKDANPLDDIPVTDFVDLTKAETDYTHASPTSASTNRRFPSIVDPDLEV